MMRPRSTIVNKLSLLAAQAPGASIAAAVAKGPERSCGQAPLTTMTPPPALSAEEDTVRSVVEGAFPHATIIYRHNDELYNENSTDAPTSGALHNSSHRLLRRSQSAIDAAMKESALKQCGLARRTVPCDFLADRTAQDQLQVEWLRAAAASDHAFLFPALSGAGVGGGMGRVGDSPDADAVAICSDATVFLGGYAGTDLAGFVAERIVSSVQVSQHAKMDAAALRTRQMLEDNRLPNYQRPTAAARDMQDKLCFLRSDVLELSVPMPLVRRGNHTGANGILAEDDDGWRRRVFVGFGNPEWCPSHLNLAERDDVRLMLRPAFGFSQYVLAERLPKSVVLATRRLRRWAASVWPVRPHPSSVFWLSAVAHELENKRRCGGARTDAAFQATADALVDAVMERFASADVPPDPWRTNYFLPVEQFERLSWWGSLCDRFKAQCVG